MALRVNVICRNPSDDRVIPRFARYLRDRLGWTLTAAPRPGYDAYYLSAYFEVQVCRKWPDAPVAAYFTHREEQPPGNAKAKLFDRTAKRVDLRMATARMYAEYLEQFGPTVQVHPPVERERFVPPPRPSPQRGKGHLVAGFSGYIYRNKRKGEDLARVLLKMPIAQTLEWRASGRGWPIHAERFSWRQMPEFYQSLDVLICTSRVEGVPMPPLEALSCGVSVVVPRGVGLLDELPDVLGIHRYKRGDVADLMRAVSEAAELRSDVDREALRATTEPYSVENWCAEHAAAFEALVGRGAINGGLADEGPADAVHLIEPKAEGRMKPKERGTGSKRGIYCVAFGDPARRCARRMMETAKRHMPDIPIALCSDREIGPEDVLIVQPDSDIGGRRAKLRAYELAPAEWQAVLYLDADTEVVAPIYRFFEWIEDGWEFVICKDPHLMDTMHAFRRPGNRVELNDTERTIYTLHTLQLNGGVWAFARNDRVQRFFSRWLAEWERYAQRDQGALIRALYAEPLRILVLGNEWNTFPKYTKGIKTAGLMHYPGRARRWKGLIRGRIDSPAAWEAVKRFERTHGHG